jgi:hypothetical protein
MKINLSEIATHARLLSEAAEERNITLAAIWAEKIQAVAPHITAAFEKRISENLEFESDLGNHQDRVSYYEEMRCAAETNPELY